MAAVAGDPLFGVSFDIGEGNDKLGSRTVNGLNFDENATENQKATIVNEFFRKMLATSGTDSSHLPYNMKLIDRREVIPQT